MGIFRIIFFIILFVVILGIVKAIINVVKNRGGRLIGHSKENKFIADELYKLHELKQRGIISQKEYEIQKNKLINSRN